MSAIEKALFKGITDKTDGKLKDVIAYAVEKNLIENLEETMNYLARHARDGRVVNLFNDYAPQSFYFEVVESERCVLNGGVIYHGPHDGYGSGASPSYSVSLNPTHGWQIHT